MIYMGSGCTLSFNRLIFLEKVYSLAVCHVMLMLHALYVCTYV